MVRVSKDGPSIPVDVNTLVGMPSQTYIILSTAYIVAERHEQLMKTNKVLVLLETSDRSTGLHQTILS
jgi:hypothetical protein